MKKQRSGVGFLVVVECIALVATLIFALIRPLQTEDKESGKKPSSENVQGEVDDTQPIESVDSQNTESNPSGNEEIIVKTEERIIFSEAVESKLASMTAEELAAQVFVITPEQLTGVEDVTASGNTTKTAYGQYPVGGVVYSQRNFQNKEQTRIMLKKLQEYSQARIQLPLFLGVAEAGGAEQSPLATSNRYDVVEMTTENVADSAQSISTYMKEQRFNMNLANVPVNTAIASEDTAQNVQSAGQWYQSLEAAGMVSTVQFMPEDVTDGVSQRSYEQMKEDELLVCKAAIDAGCGCVMLCNAKIPSLTGQEDLVYSVSANVVSMFRNNLEYNGIIMTDSLENIEGVSSADLAVSALNAGVDIVYKPSDFKGAYAAVVEAINSGKISEDRIHNAVGRILSAKEGI